MHTFYCAHRRLTGLAATFALLLISSQIVLAQPAGTTAYGDQALSSNTGANNSAFGFEALQFNATGYANTAIGSGAFSGNYYVMNSGYLNVAIGMNALLKNTVGYQNTASGSYALYSNTDGSNNVAIGIYSLDSINESSNNVAIGARSMSSFKSGTYNTASGAGALVGDIGRNPTGDYNTASGSGALSRNNGGYQNTASGFQALYYNRDGYLNTANGVNTLYTNTHGYYNTASGVQALYSNVDGNQNTASGVNALSANTSGSANTAFGYAALYRSMGSNNIGVGDHAGQNISTGSNNIDIGSGGNSADDGVIRIGTSGQTKTFISGIFGQTATQTATGGVQVYAISSGQLGTQNSSQRFKQNIHSIDDASDKLLQLRPVSFRYIEAADDGSKPLQYGLIAEEVAKVYPELVHYDQEGKPFTVYYQFLTPLMLSELQKVHNMATTQQDTLAAQQSQAASFKQQLSEDSAELFTRLQQLQQQDVADMAVLQQKLNQLDTLVQAGNRNEAPAENVALVSDR